VNENTLEIFYQTKPEYYTGDDVAITIHYKAKGQGMAEDIANQVKDYVAKTYAIKTLIHNYA